MKDERLITLEPHIIEITCRDGACPHLDKPIDNKPIDNKPIDNKPIGNKLIGNKTIDDETIVDSDPYAGHDVRVTIVKGGRSANGYYYDENALRAIAGMIEG